MTFIQVNSDALLILGNWLHSRLDFSSCNGKFMQKRHLLTSGEKEHQSGYRIQFYDIT